MKNPILNRHSLILQKDKNIQLTLPSMVHSEFSEFVLESSNFDSSKMSVSVILYLKNAFGQKIQKSITLVSGYNLFNFKSDDFNVQAEYLFFGIEANYDISVALTISEEVGTRFNI